MGGVLRRGDTRWAHYVAVIRHWIYEAATRAAIRFIFPDMLFPCCRRLYLMVVFPNPAVGRLHDHGEMTINAAGKITVLCFMNPSYSKARLTYTQVGNVKERSLSVVRFALGSPLLCRILMKAG